MPSSVRPTRDSLARLLTLAWPLIASQSIWTVQIVLDRIFLSRADAESVGAGMSAVMLFWMLLALFQFTANYATAFVAQYTGAGQPRDVGPVIGQALWFALASGLGFFLLIPLAGSIVALAGHEPHLQEQEAVYFRWMCAAALPFLITAAGTSFFAGRGDTRSVLYVNAAGLAVNGFWAYTLIYGEFGFPRMGIAGAGVATVLGGWASAL
ncbi:MAG: MATE family efflux transporter, partial [Gemmataceae bacterium]